MISFKDNFLSKEDFDSLNKSLYDRKFAWFFNDSVSIPGQDDGFYFTHTFYDNEPCSPFYKYMQPVFDKLNVKALIKVKANLYPQTDKIIKHGLHRDYEFQCKSALLMMNTCDGYTYLQEDNKKVQSVENKIIYFNSHLPHHSTTTTNAKARLTININYF